MLMGRGRKSVFFQGLNILCTECIYNKAIHSFLWKPKIYGVVSAWIRYNLQWTIYFSEFNDLDWHLFCRSHTTDHFDRLPKQTKSNVLAWIGSCKQGT